jgi:hypothetical protein
MMPPLLFDSTIRSLKDIQAQAEQIAHGRDEEHSIHAFSVYSEEIKSFLLNHVEDNECLDMICRIPLVEISVLPH